MKYGVIVYSSINITSELDIYEKKPHETSMAETWAPMSWHAHKEHQGTSNPYAAASPTILYILPSSYSMSPRPYSPNLT